MAAGRVVVVGAAGFVGRHLCARLAHDGWQVTAVTRRRERARALLPLPTLGVAEIDAGDASALARVAQGADAIVNLAGIINEAGGTTFSEAHVAVTRSCVAAAVDAGVRRLLHMSALGADAGGPSRYQRSKGEAEAIVGASELDWTIFRPSVIFGPDDSFLNLFARVLRVAPMLALASPATRFQPVYVGDVAECFARALSLPATIRGRFDLGGPQAYTLLELVRYVGEVTGHPRPVMTLGPALSKLQATMLELLPGKVMTRDNLASMQRDSVCPGGFPEVFGVVPTALEAVAPSYLAPQAQRSAYDAMRARSGR
jgi:NADH dehydrogenase